MSNLQNDIAAAETVVKTDVNAVKADVAAVKADVSAFTAQASTGISTAKSGVAAFVAKWGIPAAAFVVGLVLGHFARGA